MQSGQVKQNSGSSSKTSMTEGKDLDNHVQQEIRENAMFDSDILDLAIKVTHIYLFSFFLFFSIYG